MTRGKIEQEITFKVMEIKMENCNVCSDKQCQSCPIPKDIKKIRDTYSRIKGRK